MILNGGLLRCKADDNHYVCSTMRAYDSHDDVRTHVITKDGLDGFL
jgi:hypothetical protein